MRSLFFVVVWLQVWVAVTGYPTGAPVGKCVDMTPGHGVPGQTGPSPYTIKLNSSTFSQQQPVSVTIQGPPYVGLLLQARSGSSTNAVGTWGPPPANTKHLECSGPQSAITHDNRNPKNNETTYIWIPSNSLNTAVVRATVVANRTMFWVNMASAQLSVVPGGGSNAVADPKMAVVFLTLLMSLLLQ